MTLISTKHNYVYIHVYKVAGQSVKLALRRGDLQSVPERLRDHYARFIELPPFYSLKPYENHSTAAEIRDHLGQETWDSMYTFSFVRNPWDWQVSLYRFIPTNKFNPQRRQVGEMGFDEYIEWRVSEDLHLQSSFIFDDDGNQLVDFVGHFEHLSDDFAKVCSTIGIEGSLPHENASKRSSYQDYYNDHTRELVAEAFAADIEAFGYTFDGDAPAGGIAAGDPASGDEA